jgi:hypothetical protein
MGMEASGTRAFRRLAVALGTTAALAGSLAAATAGARVGTPAKPIASATLEGCVTSGTQLERSATFMGEMLAIPGTTRMLMRIAVQERGPADLAFHTVSYPGLDISLRAASGVTKYKNLDRVTDLSGPAAYRATIRFRWLGPKGHLLKVQELHTARCEQPELTPPASTNTSSTTAPTAASTNATSTTLPTTATGGF